MAYVNSKHCGAVITVDKFKKRGIVYLQLTGVYLIAVYIIANNVIQDLLK